MSLQLNQLNKKISLFESIIIETESEIFI